MKKKIQFNKPLITGQELDNFKYLLENPHLSGDGVFTDFCCKWLERNLGCSNGLLTHSCTAALEMAAILAEIQPGDEVIMPSYTFVSTANAFVLRGAIPVFIDIEKETCNIDINQIEKAITKKTKAIVVVHYAGVCVDMDKLIEIKDQYNLFLIEDAAQALLSEYKGISLGTIGDMGTLSFHETKNIISGEGGALLLRDNRLIDRAEIIREKGTNRRNFFRGQVDKYTWVDIGSSYLPSDIIAAFLKPQLQNSKEITESRMNIWEHYHLNLKDAEKSEKLRRPIIPSFCKHNAHMYYILLPSNHIRDSLINKLANNGMSSVFHYQPLHDSPYGKKVSRCSHDMSNTIEISETLLRLPLWVGLDINHTLEILLDAIKEI